MDKDIIKELYHATQDFIDKIASIGMKRGAEERDQILDFVDTCFQYMKNNPI